MCKYCDKGVSAAAIEDYRASDYEDLYVLTDHALYWTSANIFDGEVMWADGTCYGVEDDEEHAWPERYFLPKYCPNCGRKL